jgi:hypothetical protein
VIALHIWGLCLVLVPRQEWRNLPIDAQRSNTCNACNSMVVAPCLVITDESPIRVPCGGTLDNSLACIPGASPCPQEGPEENSYTFRNLWCSAGGRRV